MSDELASYLGKHATAMLSVAPFKFWPVEKSREDDLDAPLINYVFSEHGLAMVCDSNDAIRTIFLDSIVAEAVSERMLAVSFSFDRRQVRRRLGLPEKSGERVSDPILGEYGGWDRFARPGYAIHVEYQPDADRVKMITLMRADVAP